MVLQNDTQNIMDRICELEASFQEYWYEIELYIESGKEKFLGHIMMKEGST